MSNRKKKIAVAFLILCALFGSWFLYSMPSAWISGDKNEIASVKIYGFNEYSKITLTDTNTIEEFVSLISNTRTKIRIPFADEEMYDESDSGYLITVQYKDGINENVSYSFIHNGFQLRTGSCITISFPNYRIFDFIDEYYLEKI